MAQNKCVKGLFSFFILIFIVLTSNVSSEITVQRKLYGSGFHRDLTTAITIKDVGKLVKSKCGLLVSQNLPSGVYADPFQVQSLEQFGGPQVIFDRPVDIEAAEYISKPHQLYVYIDLLKHVSTTSFDGITVQFTLPLHGRYHKPSEDFSKSHADVAIPHLALYSNCSTSDTQLGTLDAPCAFDDSRECSWVYLPFASESPVPKMSLPVGKGSDKAVVITVTLVATLIICGVLCLTMWISDSRKQEKLS